MTKLITLADIQTLKPISANVNEVKQLNTYILEAQEFDLRPFLDVLSHFLYILVYSLHFGLDRSWEALYWSYSILVILTLVS